MVHMISICLKLAIDTRLKVREVVQGRLFFTANVYFCAFFCTLFWGGVRLFIFMFDVAKATSIYSLLIKTPIHQ